MCILLLLDGVIFIFFNTQVKCISADLVVFAKVIHLMHNHNSVLIFIFYCEGIRLRHTYIVCVFGLRQSRSILGTNPTYYFLAEV